MNSPSYQFNKIRIDSVGFNQIFKNINRNINQKRYICLVEASGVIRAQKDKKLFEAFRKSFINIADGAPLSWYGKFIGIKDAQRISGVDLLKEALENRSCYKHFLLGDTNNTINKIIKKAKKINPNLIITGFSPPFRDNFSVKENNEIINRINAMGADLIWVSFGLEKQEKWMLDNHLKINHGVLIGVGAAFRYYTGEIIIPPKFLQKIGMQWVTRFIENPNRWFRLSFLDRVKFVFAFLKEIITFKGLTRK